METGVLIVVLAGAAAGGFVSGVSGFAFGMVALSFWTWSLEPQMLSPMVVFGSLVAQLLSLGAVRHAMHWRLLLPFLVGGALGVPVGVHLLAAVDLAMFRAFVGTVLIVYGAFMLATPRLERAARGGKIADGCVGVVGGIMGGLAGLSGVAPTLWCTLRGWNKDDQRAVFQSFNLAMHILTLVGYLASGTVTSGNARTFALVVPPIAVAAWIGAKVYRHISERAFRRIVLVLLMFSGTVLLITVLRQA